MNGMLETFISQSRCLDRDTVFNLLYDRGEEVLVQCTRGGASRTFLLIGVPNIGNGGCRGGVWYYEEPDTLKDVDAICLYYGYSREVGAIAKQSEGSQFKDDYRRICRPVELLPSGLHRKTFKEILPRLTEDNLSRLWAELPLVVEVRL